MDGSGLPFLCCELRRNLYAVKSYSLDSFLPEAELSPHPLWHLQAPRAVFVPSVLLSCLAFHRSLQALPLFPCLPSLFACSIPPLTATPTKWFPGAELHPAFLHFRSSQNIDKTQMVRSTAASDRASSRTPTHHGRSQLHFHARGSWHRAGSMLGAPQKRCKGCSLLLLLAYSVSLLFALQSHQTCLTYSMLYLVTVC